MKQLTLLTIILSLTRFAYGQRNIIGEYSTILKYTWGSGLELTLNADSSFIMTNYGLTSDGPVVFQVAKGHWTTMDSTKRLILHQVVNDTLKLAYDFPFIDHNRMYSMNCKDTSLPQNLLDSFALKFYPMVLYKLKGYYPSGQLESDLPRTTSDNPDDCPPTGIWKYYYQNGNLEEEIDFTDYINYQGQVTKKEYFESGKIRSELHWKDGLKDGEWKEYDESGKLIKTLIYKRDKLKKTKTH
ncbi:MAG TPA: hypothetical protein DIW47_09670 [Bacteroidetes bacterium]|nr:hypothetical protein [Bacteroidota bacterium]